MHSTEQCTGAHCLFRIRIVTIVVPHHKGWDPIAARVALLVDGNIFLQFFPILQPAGLHRDPPCIERHGHRPPVVRSTFRSWWVHAGCCEPIVRGFLACLAGCRVTGTCSAPPERALLRIKGFCGASGEATARGVNLYADIVATCDNQTPQAAHTHRQNGLSDAACRPGCSK